MRVTSAPHFERFVRAVHRRLVGVRIVEWAGYGALAGCAAGLLLVPLLWWQGRSAFAPASFVLALGTLAGFVWGLTHRPTRLAAATEADRQLALSDLLGTATAVGAEPNDPWVRTVLALADDRCRTRFPSQVILNRLGARAWGGIGLAAALVLTLAALTSQPTELRAGSSRRASARPTTAEARQESTYAADRPTPGARPPGPASPGPREVAAQGPVNPSDQLRESSHPGRSAAPNGRSSASTDDGQGGGAGRARVPRASDPPPSDSLPPTATPIDPAAQSTTGSGRTSSTDAPPTGPDGGGATTGSGSSPQRPPPWQSDSWPADARAAEDAVTAGRVPDAYRDLVREYFRRD